MDLERLIGTVVALGAGAAVKKLSKRKGSTLHKILSPIAAVAGAAGTAVASGQEANAALQFGLEGGMTAVFGQSMWRGALATLPRTR